MHHRKRRNEFFAAFNKDLAPCTADDDGRKLMVELEEFKAQQ